MARFFQILVVLNLSILSIFIAAQAANWSLNGKYRRQPEYDHNPGSVNENGYDNASEDEEANNSNEDTSSVGNGREKDDGSSVGNSREKNDEKIGDNDYGSDYGQPYNINNDKNKVDDSRNKGYTNLVDNGPGSGDYGATDLGFSAESSTVLTGYYNTHSVQEPATSSSTTSATTAYISLPRWPTLTTPPSPVLQSTTSSSASLVSTSTEAIGDITSPTTIAVTAVETATTTQPVPPVINQTDVSHVSPPIHPSSSEPRTQTRTEPNTASTTSGSGKGVPLKTEESKWKWWMTVVLVVLVLFFIAIPFLVLAFILCRNRQPPPEPKSIAPETVSVTHAMPGSVRTEYDPDPIEIERYQLSKIPAAAYDTTPATSSPTETKEDPVAVQARQIMELIGRKGKESNPFEKWAKGPTKDVGEPVTAGSESSAGILKAPPMTAKMVLQRRSLPVQKKMMRDRQHLQKQKEDISRDLDGKASLWTRAHNLPPGTTL